MIYILICFNEIETKRKKLIYVYVNMMEFNKLGFWNSSRIRFVNFIESFLNKNSRIDPKLVLNIC